MKPTKLDPAIDKIELHHDGWDRFERAIKGAARHAPISQPQPKAPARKRRKPPIASDV